MINNSTHSKVNTMTIMSINTNFFLTAIRFFFNKKNTKFEIFKL